MHLSQLQTELKTLGRLPDAELPLVRTLIQLGALQHDMTQVEPCAAQMQQMQQALQEYAGTDDRRTALTTVIRDKFDYRAESDPEQELRSLDLLCALQRQPVHQMILAALYLELARSQSWVIDALSFPHVLLLRIEQQGQLLLFDPAQPDKLLNAGDLRHILQQHAGPTAALDHAFYTPLNNREIALRICNRIKTLLIARGDYLPALQNVQHALWIAPDEPRLYFDAGVLCMKIEREPRAARYFEDFIQRSTDQATLAEAHNLLRGLYGRLQ